MQEDATSPLTEVSILASLSLDQALLAPAESCPAVSFH